MIQQLTYACVLLCLSGPLLAQDSVSKLPCLPGDGTAPWADATDPLGSEQCDAYVVRLAPVVSSWSNTYQVGPLVKSSKAQGQYLGSLTSGSGMSRLQGLGVPFAATSYDEWIAAPGAGVNNDPQLSDPGTAIDTSAARGHRFAAGVSEFASSGANYNGLITAVVDLDPTDPTRLFVLRTMAAVNGCSGIADFSQFGFGSITENGEAVFRIDGFGTGGGPCIGLTTVATDNLLRVDTLARDCSIRNVISDESIFGTGEVDAGATTTVFPLSSVTLGTPSIVPSSVTGGAPMTIGTDFSMEFVSGVSAVVGVSATTAHLAPGVVDQRGNLSWSPYNFDFLGSTHGTCAVIGLDAASQPTTVNVFGISISGTTTTVTGTAALTLPASISDALTGFTPAASPLLTHYHSQVAYRGSNGQIALQRDPSTGELLVAATVSNDGTSSAADDDLSIAVARVNPTTGAATWSVAAYNSPTGAGKPILDGPGGTAIGEIGTLFTGLPNVGVPMLSATGDVFFVAAVEQYSPAKTSVGLVRAAYNGAGYELERILDTGAVVAGANSGRNYAVTYFELNDTNSLGSGTPFSQNMLSSAHLSQDPSSLAPGAIEGLGGLVLAVEITYDYEPDGDYDPCTATSPADPLTEDPDYNVLFYVGVGTPGSDVDGNGRADESEMLQGDSIAMSLAAGGSVNFDLHGGIENAGLGYYFLGSVTGTGPDPFGYGIPLTFDAYFNLRLNKPSIFFAFGTAFLDAKGQASDVFSLPAGFDPTIAGLTAYHSYAIFDVFKPGLFVTASNAWVTKLNP